MSSEKPEHQLAPDEVDSWLADSVVRTVTVHHTDPESALDIIEHGVDIAKSTLDAAWGQGFYSRTNSDPQHGSIAVWVAVRLMQPLEIMDSVRDAEILEELTQRASTEDFRVAILASGYDGVLVHYGQHLVVVAFHNEQVKVMLREDDDA